MVPIGLSNEIAVGTLKLGGNQAVRIQSMTNTDTNDVQASVEQCIRMIQKGADLVRLTTQGKREVENLARIRAELRNAGHDTPVVADIHFKPGLALEAAKITDKIRINPGNYLRGASPESVLPELLDTCSKYGTAIRIGVNHGSLEESIMNRYGDTPEGMAESAMVFLRICQAAKFNKVVVSMKSSNPKVMVQSVRLLVHKMQSEGMFYPLHLGVTEAGDGPEGRIKSAVGMAPLLLEGMGDTLRVSLTEAPEEELPVAAAITRLFPKPDSLPYDPFGDLAWNPFGFIRRMSSAVAGMGKGSRIRIVGKEVPDPRTDMHPGQLENLWVTYDEWLQDPSLLESGDKILLLEKSASGIQEIKARLSHFCSVNSVSPILYKACMDQKDSGTFQLQLAGELGFLLVDGALDGVWIEHPRLPASQVNETLLMVLQAAGARITKTEYVACPSCGRTHFDILSRLKEIRKATSHLSTLKIGVMGCIVNGPGEMADADYGYVGAGPGKVSIYKGKRPMLRNIPEKEALDALLRIMKQEGDWIDP
jgi:(E)-4-hydroxy-3-methylbut-2-enyl-diphosphate synthase